MKKSARMVAGNLKIQMKSFTNSLDFSRIDFMASNTNDLLRK